MEAVKTNKVVYIKAPLLLPTVPHISLECVCRIFAVNLLSVS
jgi:hypothetical protein